MGADACISRPHPHLPASRVAAYVTCMCTRITELFCADIGNLVVDIGSFFERWMKDLFVGVLPYQTALRIIDFYVASGKKTILRVSLELLRMFEDELLKTHGEGEFLDLLAKLCRELPEDIDVGKNSCLPAFLQQFPDASSKRIQLLLEKAKMFAPFVQSLVTNVPKFYGFDQTALLVR
jgi:hypothetical protein